MPAKSLLKFALEGNILSCAMGHDWNIFERLLFCPLHGNYLLMIYIPDVYVCFNSNSTLFNMAIIF